jgi:ribosomal protein S12 methylthiotransferase accessory factor
MDREQVEHSGRLAAYGLCRQGGRTRASGRPLIDYPRLPHGAVIFPGGPGVVLRSVVGAVGLRADDQDWFLCLAGRLDGRTSLRDVLRGFPSSVAIRAMRLLADLTKAGIIRGGPPVAPATSVARRLDGVRVNLTATSRLDTQLARALIDLGADVKQAAVEKVCSSGAVALYAPDRPEPLFRTAVAHSVARWDAARVAVLPFGDAVLLGRGIDQPDAPCLACFAEIWLGLSPSITLEREFLAHLDSGTSAPDLALNGSEVAILLPLIADLLSSPSKGGDITMFDRDTGETVTTRVVPHPNCPVCAKQANSSLPEPFFRATMLDRSSPLPVEHLSARLAPFVGLPSGLAAVLPPLARFPKALKRRPAVAVARYAVADPDIVVAGQSNLCHGSGASAAEAETLAVVEAAERFAGLARPAAARFACFGEFRGAALCPTELPLFSNTQYAKPGFPFRPFSPAASYWWVAGWNVTCDQRVWIPLSAASYGYDDGLVAESSSGIAAHSCRASALVNACLELIERDAFMIHWLNWLTPPRIPTRHADTAECSSMLSDVRATGSEVHLLDLTTDLGVPVCLALAVHLNGLRPALTIGAGAALDMSRAVTRAVRELYAASLSPGADWSTGLPMAPKDVRSLEDNARAYSHPDWLKHAAFLWAATAPATDSLTSCRGDDALRTLLELFAARGYDMIAVDLTPRALNGTGLHVVRAIVPGLQPLALGAGPRLGGRRLFEAPVRMGRRATQLAEAALNPLPHCFP